MVWILYYPTLGEMKVSNETSQVNRNEFRCEQYKSKKAPEIKKKKKSDSPSQNCCLFSTLSETSSRSMTSLIKGASPFKNAFVSFRGGSGRICRETRGAAVTLSRLSPPAPYQIE